MEYEDLPLDDYHFFTFDQSWGYYESYSSLLGGIFAGMPAEFAVVKNGARIELQLEENLSNNAGWLYAPKDKRRPMMVVVWNN